MSQPVPISSYSDYLEYVARKAHHRAMEKTYPRFQFSVFLDGNRDQQVVVRAESLEEFTKLKAAVVPLLNGQAEPKPGKGNGAVKTYQCDKCGGEAEYREGVSKKSNKPYQGVFCRDKDCHYAQFL